MSTTNVNSMKKQRSKALTVDTNTTMKKDCTEHRDGRKRKEKDEKNQPEHKYPERCTAKRQGWHTDERGASAAACRRAASPLQRSQCVS